MGAKAWNDASLHLFRRNKKPRGMGLWQHESVQVSNEMLTKRNFQSEDQTGNTPPHPANMKKLDLLEMLVKDNAMSTR
jgi:hypothetical protein